MAPPAHRISKPGYAVTPPSAVRLQTSTIVEGLDVLEDGRAELGPRPPSAAVDELLLQSREEGLGDGVVPTVSFAAHADGDAELLQTRPVIEARVLAPSVGVMQQT